MKKLILFLTLLASINSVWGMKKEQKYSVEDKKNTLEKARAFFNKHNILYPYNQYDDAKTLIEATCKKFNIPYYYDLEDEMVIVTTKLDELKEKDISTFADVASEELSLDDIQYNEDIFTIAEIAYRLGNKEVYNLCSQAWLKRIYGIFRPLIHFSSSKKYGSKNENTSDTKLHLNSLERIGECSVKNPTFEQLSLIQTIYQNDNINDRTQSNPNKIKLNKKQTKILSTFPDYLLNKKGSLSSYSQEKPLGPAEHEVYVWSKFPLE